MKCDLFLIISRTWTCRSDTGIRIYVVQQFEEFSSTIKEIKRTQIVYCKIYKIYSKKSATIFLSIHSKTYKTPHFLLYTNCSVWDRVQGKGKAKTVSFHRDSRSLCVNCKNLVPGISIFVIQHEDGETRKFDGTGHLKGWAHYKTSEFIAERDGPVRRAILDSFAFAWEYISPLQLLARPLNGNWPLFLTSLRRTCVTLI